jgi:hypothetical protein
MTGPVIPGDFACHYTPMEEPRVVAERYMNPPTFRGIDIERHNQVIKVQITKLSHCLEQGFPTWGTQEVGKGDASVWTNDTNCNICNNNGNFEWVFFKNQ